MECIQFKHKTYIWGWQSRTKWSEVLRYNWIIEYFQVFPIIFINYCLLTRIITYNEETNKRYDTKPMRVIPIKTAIQL